MLFGKQEYPSLFHLIKNYCKKSIITSGSPKSFKRHYPMHGTNNNISYVKINYRNNFLSFACSKHNDFCDNLTKGALSDMFEQRCHSMEMKQMLNLLGPTMPTTCQYRHMWNNSIDMKEYDVFSYFIFDSLGIAQCLYDSCSILFLGAKFTHCTSVCYLIHKITKTILIRNSDNTFTIFAWGRLGGPADFIESV